MPLKIEIPDNHLSSLKEYYNGVYEKFKDKAQPLVNEWLEISPILSQLGIIKTEMVSLNYFTRLNVPEVKSIPTNVDGFNKGWGWLTKSKFIISKLGIDLTPKEIIKQLFENYEPDIDLNLAKNSVPATLSVAFKDGKIFRTTNKNGEYVYNLLK